MIRSIPPQLSVTMKVVFIKLVFIPPIVIARKDKLLHKVLVWAPREEVTICVGSGRSPGMLQTPTHLALAAPCYFFVT